MAVPTGARLARELGVRLRVRPAGARRRGVRVAGRRDRLGRRSRTRPTAVATATPGVAPLVLTADCLPIAIAGRGAVAMRPRRLAGACRRRDRKARRRGRARARRGRPARRRDRPGRGCLLLRGRRRAARSALPTTAPDVRGGRQPRSQAIAARQLEAAGVERGPRRRALHDLLRRRTLFFSHRRDRGVTGRQAGIAWLT